MTQPAPDPLPHGPFWPWSPRAALITAGLLLVLLIAATVIAYLVLRWPPEPLLGWVLLFAAVVGLLPLLLSILNRLATEGGSLQIAGVLEFAFDAARAGPASLGAAHVEGNLGAPPGAPIGDSGGTSIISALNMAVNSPVAVIDLGPGDEWWETRLLVLLSGAARLGSPRAVVFTATRQQRRGDFLGWGTPAELLRQMVAVADPKLVDALRLAEARTLMWRLRDPSWAADPQPGALGLTGRPVAPWPAVPVVHSGPSKALVPESILMQELGGQEAEAPAKITVRRLEDLFDPILRTSVVEDSASEDDKLAAVLSTTDPYLAVVDHGRYVTMIPRDVALNAALRGLLAGAVRNA